MFILLVYILFFFLSIISVFCSNNWLTIWILIEINVVAIIPVLSSNLTSRSIEATVKYFVFQSIGSLIFLLGIIIHFFYSGSFLVGMEENSSGILFLVLGLIIKLGLFPSHFWFVDVVSGLNYFEGCFVIIFSKIAPLYLLIILSGSTYIVLFSIVGLVSVFVGSVFGVNQIQLRKIIALSSISHLGWMIIVFPLISGNLSFLLFIFYILMLVPILWVGNFYSLEHLTKLKNISSNILLLVTFLVCFLSLAGFPPLMGFFYKWLIFHTLIINGSFILGSYLLLLSLVSLFFYLQCCYNLYSIYWPVKKVNLLGGMGENYFKWGSILVLVVFLIIIVMSLLFFIQPLSIGFNL